MLEFLDCADVSVWDDEALTERFRQLELQRRAMDFEQAAIVREGERRGLHTLDGHRSMKQWIIAHTNGPAADAARLRRLASALGEHAEIGATLQAGHIGTAQANELARLTANPRVADQLAPVLPILLQHAEHLRFDDFRVVTRRWEMLADLDGAERDDEMSHELRTASVLHVEGSLRVQASGGSGMATAEVLGIFRRFVEAEFAKDVSARTAEHGPDAPASMLPRTDAQRRYDALVEIFRAAAVAPADGVAPEPVVNLLVGERGLERMLARRGMGVEPEPPDPDEVAELLMTERLETTTGVPIAPDDVIAACLAGVVRRVVLDSASVVVDAGRKRRLFTGVARELALMLWQHCTHLGCTVPAELCQVDHLHEHAHGGATDQVNGGPRCSTHNPLKTARRIRSGRDPNGYLVDHRSDGTPMLPVGRRAPTTEEQERRRRRAAEHGWECRFYRMERGRIVAA
jgi:hypothetical protein